MHLKKRSNTYVTRSVVWPKQFVQTADFINKHGEKDWGLLKYKKCWILLGSGKFTQLKSKIIGSSNIQPIFFKGSDSAEEVPLPQDVSTPRTYSLFVLLFQDQIRRLKHWYIKDGCLTYIRLSKSTKQNCILNRQMPMMWQRKSPFQEEKMPTIKHLPKDSACRRNGTSKYQPESSFLFQYPRLCSLSIFPYCSSAPPVKLASSSSLHPTALFPVSPALMQHLHIFFQLTPPFLQHSPPHHPSYFPLSPKRTENHFSATEYPRRL